MIARRRAIQILGWISVIAGYVFALGLVRGIFIGFTRGFGGHPNPYWVVIAYLLFFAMAAYLFAVGRRAIWLAKGLPRSSPRLGWGRILLGAFLIFAFATTQFHLLPSTVVRHHKDQARAGSTTRNVVAVTFYIIGGYLIVSGISRPFRQQKPKAAATA